MLTVAEYAARMRVSEATVYRAIGRGELKVERLGRVIRIPDPGEQRTTPEAAVA